MANEFDLEFSLPEKNPDLALQEDPAAIAEIMGEKKKQALSKALLSRSTSLISNVYQLVRTAQIHDLNNEAFRAPLEAFCKEINSLPSEEEFQVSFVEDLVFVNENRLKTDLGSFLSIKNLGKELNLRALGGVTFRKGISAEELKQFIQLFVRLDQKIDAPLDTLRSQMESAKILHVFAEGVRKMNEFEQMRVSKEDRNKFAMKTYFHAISSYKAIMKNIQNAKFVDGKKAKKIVQNLVDLCLEEGASMMGLSTIKDFDEYTYNHSVNVCILSIAFGAKLGLDKKQLCELGAAALFHDLGKTHIPVNVLNKTGKFSDEEWEMMKAHPVLGVKALLRMKGFSESTIYRVLVAFEHHIGFDGSGYPLRQKDRPLHFYSRIVSICDTFDAMTTARVYQKAMRPDECLRLMSKTVAKRYDPLLLKAFVNTVGVFPVGTLVQLSSGEIAIVIETHVDAAFIRQPKVKIAMDKGGHLLQPPPIIDLSETTPDGKFKTQIVKSLDPKDYRIHIPHYVLT